MPFDYAPDLTDGIVRLRRMTAADIEPLYAVASDPLIWAQHPVSHRHTRSEFQDFCDIALNGPGTFIIEDASAKASRAIIGSTRFHDFDANVGEVEIGWTFLARAHWGGDTNARVKRLMLDYAFGFVDIVVLLAGPDNHRSRRAIEKIGGVLRGARPNARGEPSVEYIVRQP